MKLGNTKTENELRAELRASRDAISNSAESIRLKRALMQAYEDFESGCVLHWTPDQCEDIYVVLVNGPKLISIELDRANKQAEPIMEHISVTEYKHGLKKMDQIKLAIALEVLGE